MIVVLAFGVGNNQVRQTEIELKIIVPFFFFLFPLSALRFD